MNEELRMKLKETHSDEVSDIEKYRNIRRMAKEHGCVEISKYVHDIIHDEMSHAELLENILDKEEWK